MRSFADPETHFQIQESGTPPNEDGLGPRAPKWLACDECGARVRIDGPDGHQTAIDELPHDHDCAQRDVKSRYWRQQFADA